MGGIALPKRGRLVVLLQCPPALPLELEALANIFQWTGGPRPGVAFSGQGAHSMSPYYGHRAVGITFMRYTLLSQASQNCIVKSQDYS